jgi:lipopolysaccharide export system permease protein
MTFAICLFIILMQFLWKYVEDLVGKGLDTAVLGELFVYAALTLMPMALPLAILLASLMTFGNLGEKYELLAIKASGVSLLRVMKPLIALVILISIGAFFFQNDVIPKAQVKFRALMISIRQKSPELDIPENTFNSEIDNYNLYVKTKDKDTGMLYGIMIYDVSQGFDNMALIVCDSGKLEMASNKEYLLFTLFDGQQFRNFQQSGGIRKTSYGDKFVPYSRESFKVREVIIPFNGAFTRMDESTMDGTQFSKNIWELRSSIDSLGLVVDSMNVKDRQIMFASPTLSYRNTSDSRSMPVRNGMKQNIPAAYDFDSVFTSLSQEQKSSVFNDAVMRAENVKNDLMFRSMAKIDAQRKLRQHDVELQRKFVLSFACLVFFFIGAPLGAIIRKGGLGMPVVISVCLFIVYYIIDNIGYKMARDGVWAVWQGVWLSSFVLFPLGVFITYKAINDSALFNPEAYGRYFRKALLLKRPKRMAETEREEALAKIPALSQLMLPVNTVKSLEIMDSDDLRAIVDNNKGYSYDKEMRLAALSILRDRDADINSIINRMNTQYSEAILELFAESSRYTIIAYAICILSYILGMDFVVNIFAVAYLVLYIRSSVYYFNFYGKVNKKTNIYNVLTVLLLFILYPVLYLPVIKRMKAYIKKTQINMYS